MVNIVKSYLDRFHQSYTEGEPTECWNWDRLTANPGKAGKIPPYGIMNTKFEDGKHKLCLAHRIMYEQVHGAILKGRLIRHTCNNPKCVNPAHLVSCTRGEVTKLANYQGKIGGVHAGALVTCPHCGVQGGAYVMNRWHMNACKLNPTNQNKD